METTKQQEIDAAGLVRRAASMTVTGLCVAAERCRACPRWRQATQTVFGEGAARARIMLVGEQPGADEDQQGRPFVGPAGALLSAALAEAGIERRAVYVTSAVKHFKRQPQGGRQGGRRIHQRPNRREIEACRPWLLAEIAVVKPHVLIGLGVTAAESLLGRPFRVTQHRGEMVSSDLAPFVMATVHPWSILHAPVDTRAAERARFVADLRIAARL